MTDRDPRTIDHDATDVLEHALRHVPIPAHWSGSATEWVACLRATASLVLATAAPCCDSAQRFGPDHSASADFNAGVVRAARMLMDMASALAEPDAPRPGSSH